mmetsp:Transcript_116224/g.323042  ORF Transcript_116224/g.323042 Transcript_116224/m.323042 type:complete len:215 (-) Transcript_116224:160-804(-)
MHSHFVNEALTLVSECCFASQSDFRPPLSVVAQHSAHFQATTLADMTASICSSAASCASNSAKARWRFASRSWSARLANLERMRRTESLRGSAWSAAGGSSKPIAAKRFLDRFFAAGMLDPPPCMERAALRASSCRSSSHAIRDRAAPFVPGSGMPLGNLFKISAIAARLAISSAVGGGTNPAAAGGATPGSAPGGGSAAVGWTRAELPPAAAA